MTMEPPVRLITAVVAVADEVTRAASRGALRRLRRIRVVAEVGTAPDVIAVTQRLAPDIILLSPALAGQVLVPLREVARQERLGTRVLLVGQPCSDMTVLDALAAGAHGHVAVHAIAEHLPRAVRVVADGEVWCSRALVPELLERLFGRDGRRCPRSQYPLVQ